MPFEAVLGVIIAAIANYARSNAAEAAVESDKRLLASLKQEKQEKQAELRLAMDAGVIEGELNHLKWDDGCRLLLKCKACGGYVLLQKYEFHGFTSDDSYYSDYFPVSGPEEAAELNLRFSGDGIEHDFSGRYIMRDNLMAPHWSEGEKFDPKSPEDKEVLEHFMHNLEKIRQSIVDD